MRSVRIINAVSVWRRSRDVVSPCEVAARCAVGAEIDACTATVEWSVIVRQEPADGLLGVVVQLLPGELSFEEV